MAEPVSQNFRDQNHHKSYPCVLNSENISLQKQVISCVLAYSHRAVSKCFVRFIAERHTQRSARVIMADHAYGYYHTTLPSITLMWYDTNEILSRFPKRKIALYGNTGCFAASMIPSWKQWSWDEGHEVMPLDRGHEGRLKSSWTDSSAPLLYIRRRWLLCQVVVVEVT